MLLGVSVFIAIFAFVKAELKVDQLLVAVVKSIPAQYLSWSIGIDLLKRIKANSAKGIQKKGDDQVRADYENTVNSEFRSF